MAGTVPSEFGASKSGLYPSDNGFPSGLLRDSVQLQGTSAPFGDIPSDEDTIWPRRRQQELSEGDSEEEVRNMTAASATPGPSRPLGAASSSTPHGPDDPRLSLKHLLGRLNQGPDNSPSPPQFAVRSEAASDLSTDDDYRQLDSAHTTFKRIKGQDNTEAEVSTPKHAPTTSKLPVSSGRKAQRWTSTDNTSRQTPHAERELTSDEDVERLVTRSEMETPSFQRSDSKSFAVLRDRIQKAEFPVSVPSSDAADSPPPSPPPENIENLNESVIDLPSFPSSSNSANFTAPPIESLRQSPIPAVRARTTSAGAVARPRSNLIPRQRPVSSLSFGREYGEIPFNSTEVQSSTPIKTKAERQQELEHAWGRPSSSGHASRNSSRPVSPLVMMRSDSRESDVSQRESSPVEVWEKGRERNWNNPRPKELGPRPLQRSESRESLRSNGSAAGSNRRASYDGSTYASRSRTSSVSSVASNQAMEALASSAKGKETHARRPSASPMPISGRSSVTPGEPRQRTVSTPSSADLLRDRERSWGKNHVPTTPHTSHTHTHSHTPHTPNGHTPNTTHSRPNSMTGLDGAVQALRGSSPSPAPVLSRSQSLGNRPITPARNSSISGHSRSGANSSPPASILIRRTSMIDAVREEAEPEPSHSNPIEIEIEITESPSAITPPEKSVASSSMDMSSARPATPQRSRSAKDVSRLQSMLGSTTPGGPPPSTTTPNNSPPKPSTAAEAPSTTPKESPLKPKIFPAQETPTKRELHQWPKELPLPSPPKGGLPSMSSSDESDSDGKLKKIKETPRGVVTPLQRFGSNRSFVTKTPRPPGGWGTPANTTQPPFDDREHPHPKGQAVEALKLEATDAHQSDSESSQPTPVLRPKEIDSATNTPAKDEANPFNAGPETPVGGLFEGQSQFEQKTPAPPGHWANTPMQRKSILKVRFDAPTVSSQNKQLSRPTTPDAVAENAQKILENLAGVGGMPDEGGSVRSVKVSPTKRPGINMVDSFGRELMFASDGTPIKRLDERAERQRTFSWASDSSMAHISPVASVAGDPPPVMTTAVEQHVSTPRRRERIRMLNALGEDISGASTPDGSVNGSLRRLDTSLQAGDVVDLNSPTIDNMDTQSDISYDDSHPQRTDKIKKLRHDIDHLRSSSVEDLSAPPDDSTTLEHLLERSVKLEKLREESQRSTDERNKLQRQLQLMRANRPKSLKSRERQYVAWWRSAWAWIVLFLNIAVLGGCVKVAHWYAEYKYLTTHYDPLSPGFHDMGDHVGPALLHWAVFGREVTMFGMLWSWFSDLVLSSFGYGGLHVIVPNMVPT